MSDDLEVTGGVGGMDRRDFIRKGAIVGGMAGMVWAAPAISSIGSHAFAGTPIGVGVSNFAFIVNNADWTFKYEAGEESLDGTQAMMPCVGALPDQYTTEWCEASSGDDQATVTTETVTIDGEAYVKYTITVADSTNYTLGWLVVMEGSGQDDPCYFKDLPDGTIEFSFTRNQIFGWTQLSKSSQTQC